MNKFYFQNVFFLLSIFVYANNEALASEPDLRNHNMGGLLYSQPTPEEIYEKNKHLLCANPDETREAVKLMNEALLHLVYHAKNDDNYKSYRAKLKFATIAHKKKHEDNTDILRINLKINDPDQYNYSINKVWNPDIPNSFNTGYVKIVRVYTPNLVMIQQRYKQDSKEPQKYFYALAKRAEISDNATIIVMTSANINDHNPSNKKYENTLIKNANLFTTEIDSEDDIRNGKLEKVFVNLAGYLIEKKTDHIDALYVESIDGHATA
ncbi:fam-a protein [Plasmodium chabaudi chabaudi]|uniref:Fam-a protein n=1 Tax=Plasmodium chabaudi chabaudi TaxID=31271 RepID=A0A4V0K4T9_PLACU|nr:fam-a protein [Plasmodium chabaudi chabaudi]VTZ67890.1 fam-a protein [Plasmodium chabaudi chabaudi]|eukprot:XP_016653517.1 fam-a protein [Plasmodium chabaudi chabaudi]